MPRMCQFEPAGPGGLRCASCGFTVEIRGSGEARAVCGFPRSLRVFHGDTGRAGVGTHLKRLLSYVGITAGKGCECGPRADQMDREGPEWCDKNTDLIVGWLEEEAKNRGLWFFNRAAARMLVRKAIRLARKDSGNASGPSLPLEREALAVEVYPAAGSGGRLDLHEGPEKPKSTGAGAD